MEGNQSPNTAEISRLFLALKTLIKSGEEDQALDFLEEKELKPHHLRNESGSWLGFHCPVCSAAKHGKVKVMKSLIERGFAYENCFDDDVTFYLRPIHLGAYHGRLEIVKLLIDLGVDVDVRDNFDNTPLYWAISKPKADLEIVKYLLDRGANVNTRNDIDCTTALHTSVSRFGKFEICHFLIQNGTEVDARDNSGYTPLHYAAMNGHVASARALLAAGADIEARSRGMHTPFHEAGYGGQLDMIRMLLMEGADPEIRDDSEITPLHVACLKSEYEIAKFLIVEANVDPNPVLKDGVTPFRLAVLKCSTALVKLLVGAGCVSIPDKDLDLIPFQENVSAETKADMTEFVKNVLTNPRSLQDLCIFKIRRFLGRHVQTDADSLPLPSVVRDVVKLYHMTRDNDNETK